MKGIYLTEEGKKEIESKIAELENLTYATQKTWVKVQNSGMVKILEEILSSATILPVEENWENVKDLLDINTFPISYKNGVIIYQNDSEITEQGIEAKAELVPPERTMELCKAVLEYLGSRLNQDIEPKPSLNSVACLAADIMKELRHDEFDFSKKQVQEKTCICNSCKKEGKNDFMPNGLLLFFPIVYRLKNGEIPHNGLEYVAGGYYCGYLCRDCFFAKLNIQTE
jgi:hypothetical protein